MAQAMAATKVSFRDTAWTRSSHRLVGYLRALKARDRERADLARSMSMAGTGRETGVRV